MNNEAQYKYQPKCRKPHSKDMEPPALTVLFSVYESNQTSTAAYTVKQIYWNNKQDSNKNQK